jgi:hypothetical protein
MANLRLADYSAVAARVSCYGGLIFLGQDLFIQSVYFEDLIREREFGALSVF